MQRRPAGFLRRPARSLGPVPAIQRIGTAADLAGVIFHGDMAAIEVPVEAVAQLPFKNDVRSDDPRLKAVRNQIRWYGYNNSEPIVVRIGRRDRWVVVDGGHRLTAAQQVAREWLPNLWRRKVGALYIIAFRTPLSGTRVDAAHDLPTV